MKHITRFCLVLLSVFISGYFSQVKAEGPDFIVFYLKGKAHKNVNGKLLEIKRGDQIFSAENIHLSDKSELVLICRNYATIRLKAAGKYAIKNLLLQCRRDEKSLTAAYFKYVWSEFTHPHGAPEKSPKEYMKNTGAVVRGHALFTFNVATDTIHYYDGCLALRWQEDFKNLNLAVYDASSAGRILWKGKADGVLRIDSIATFLPGKGKIYYLELSDGLGRKEKRKHLQIWDAALYNKAIRDLEDKASQVPADRAESLFLTGFLMEENHFLAEAAKYYKQALEMMPANKIYQQAVSRFNSTN